MNNTDNTASNGSKYHVPNLERALKIFELLAFNPEGLNITQIVDQLDFPRNSVFRITSTLLNCGYLERDEDSKDFRLTGKLLTLGYSAISELSLVEKSLGVMRKLRDRVKETVPLGILHGNEGLVIEEVPGSHSFRFVLEPGKTFCLHTSAPGKAMVAYLPVDEQNEIIEKIRFHRFNDRTITSKQSYRKALKQVVEQGYAFDYAEENEGMHCIGAPVFNRHGYPVAAIWITGPSSRIQYSQFHEIGVIVKEYAETISRSLGYDNSINNKY